MARIAAMETATDVAMGMTMAVGIEAMAATAATARATEAMEDMTEAMAAITQATVT